MSDALVSQRNRERRNRRWRKSFDQAVAESLAALGRGPFDELPPSGLFFDWSVPASKREARPYPVGSGSVVKVERARMGLPPERWPDWAQPGGLFQQVRK